MARYVTRRTALIAVAGSLAGCTDGIGTDTGDGDGTDGETPATEDASGQGDLALTSPAFDDGDSIPAEYGRNERNVNPPLAIDGVPDDAASLALVVDDPDAGESSEDVWIHWIVWNVDPGIGEIPEDWEPTDAVEGENDFGETGYGGPDPPGETHTYRFKVYALDTTLDVSAGSTAQEVGEAMVDHVLARSQLEGTYGS